MEKSNWKLGRPSGPRDHSTGKEARAGVQILEQKKINKVKRRLALTQYDRQQLIGNVNNKFEPS